MRTCLKNEIAANPQKYLQPFDARADLRQQQSREHTERQDMRAAPHGGTVAAVHAGQKHKGQLGFWAQAQKSALMARPPLRNPAMNIINMIRVSAVPQRASFRIFFLLCNICVSCERFRCWKYYLKKQIKCNKREKQTIKGASFYSLTTFSDSLLVLDNE